MYVCKGRCPGNTTNATISVLLMHIRHQYLAIVLNTFTAGHTQQYASQSVMSESFICNQKGLKMQFLFALCETIIQVDSSHRFMANRRIHKRQFLSRLCGIKSCEGSALKNEYTMQWIIPDDVYFTAFFHRLRAGSTISHSVEIKIVFNSPPTWSSDNIAYDYRYDRLQVYLL